MPEVVWWVVWAESPIQICTALTYLCASRQNSLPKKKTALETALVDYETFQDDWELPEGHPEAVVEVSHAYLKTFFRPFLAVKIVQFWPLLASRWEALPKPPNGSSTKVRSEWKFSMINEAENSRDAPIDTRKWHATVICAIGRRLSHFLSVPRPFLYIFENARKYRDFFRQKRF